ncbi:universal stress protein [Alkaliphilus transvaalensis]|uniref:universal stress protein n=1 Tax=Alkaliphilus transvaalensis TaxID=114628 RepID=UPI000479F58F|nr:universal stress protein [Alkaliphilus transvaalensis]
MIMKKVLIATDFSPAAEELLNCISELKAMGMEEAVLVHVVDIRLGEEASIPRQQLSLEKLKETAEKLHGFGVKTKSYTPIGFAATEIVQIAKAEEVSLILIGSKGKSIVKEVFLGSTTFDVIRLTDVPVLVEKYCKGESSECVSVCINKFQKVLLPIDFSECSRSILEKVKAMAGVVQEVILLTVVEQGESDKQVEEAQTGYTEYLMEVAEELRQLGISTKVVVEVGIPSVCINKWAEAEQVTSIIMGTRGKGLIKSLLLGSTSDAVARTAKRPVVLIPCNS